jgi:hypothetical protein
MGGSSSRSATSSGIGAHTTPEDHRIVQASHCSVAGRRLRREDDVTLVLAVLVVGHEDRQAAAQRVQGLLDGRQGGRHALTSLVSRATGVSTLEARSHTKKP